MKLEQDTLLAMPASEKPQIQPSRVVGRTRSGRFLFTYLTRTSDGANKAD